MGTSKSSILMGFSWVSIINHSLWGTPIYGTPQMSVAFRCWEAEVVSYHKRARSRMGRRQKQQKLDQLIPICSMYGIFTYIYPKNCPNVGKYSIHGAYGIWILRVLISKIANYIKLLFFFPDDIYNISWVSILQDSARASENEKEFTQHKLMWVKLTPCLPPMPMTGNGKHTTYLWWFGRCFMVLFYPHYCQLTFHNQPTILQAVMIRDEA